jgi:hypothetical protein
MKVECGFDDRVHGTLESSGGYLDVTTPPGVPEDVLAGYVDHYGQQVAAETGKAPELVTADDILLAMLAGRRGRTWAREVPEGEGKEAAGGADRAAD